MSISRLETFVHLYGMSSSWCVAVLLANIIRKGRIKNSLTNTFWQFSWQFWVQYFNLVALWHLVSSKLDICIFKKIELVENEDIFIGFNLFDFDDWGKQTIWTSAAPPTKPENVEHVSCKWPSEKED